MLQKRKHNAWITAYPFTTCLIEYFKPNIESYCSGKKKFLSKYYFTLAMHGSAVMNPTSIQADEGLIPGLVKWVKDPVLL